MEFEKKYKLIQQTPIIHFQYDQKGATLRATEVKPKLDRFIINKLENINEKWFVGKTKALNYKMQITSKGESKKSQSCELAIQAYEIQDKNPSKSKKLSKDSKTAINEMYFANMVSNDEADYCEKVKEVYKETVFFGSDCEIELKIVCFIPELLAAVNNYIEEFFAVTNFGTRQSKGFGGFVLKYTDGEESKYKNPVEMLNDCGYNFFYAKCDTYACDPSKHSYDLLLNHAKVIYAVLKGGINFTGWTFQETPDDKHYYKHPERYIKGYIQRQFIDDFYCNSESIGSDKACIKANMSYCRKFFERYNGVYPKNRHGNADNDKKYEPYLFVRALLGLADKYEYKDDIRKGSVFIYSLGDDSFDVERFKSPITIKIIDDYVIFIFGSFAEICNKTFYIAPKGKPAKNFDEMDYKAKKKAILTYKDKNGKPLCIPIETPEKFDENDVRKLIKGFINYFNNTIKDKNNNLLSKFEGTDIKSTLKLTLEISDSVKKGGDDNG